MEGTPGTETAPKPGEEEPGNEPEPTTPSGGDGDGEGGKEEPKKEESKGKVEVDQSFMDEFNRLKREASERDKRERDAERKKQEDEGKWKEMAEADKKRADDAEAKVATLEREKRVAKVGGEVGLKDPDDAGRFLTDEQMSDDASARTALDTLKQKRPELFGEVRRSGGEVQPEDEETSSSRKKEEEVETQPGLDRLRKVKRKN